jgi:hypothetical protein
MESDYINYFLSQHGGGLSDIGSPYKMKRIVQQGYGFPVLVQEGQGIGTLFQSLYHLMRPLIVSGLSAIKSEASVAGKNILRDITTKPITKLLAEEGNRAIGNLKRRANDQIGEMSGKGVKRTRKSIKNQSDR